MPVASAISRLPYLPPPVLTAYLDINPGNPRNQGTPRGYLTWLKSTGQELSQDLPQSARKQLRGQVKRISDYLQNEKVAGRGLAIFAGPHVWEIIPLQVEVADELHWGKPSLQQMMWLLDEHRARGVVVIDGSGARFFRFWLGAVVEDEAETYYADFASWRKPYLVGPATSGVAKQRGVHRDSVKDRMEAQRNRFIRMLGERIQRWSSEEQISPVLLVGDAAEGQAILNALPEELRREAAVVQKTLPWLSASDVKKRLEPVLKAWERQYEAELVDELVSGQHSQKAVTGVDQTLAQLQQGQVRELVVARGITGAVQECMKCGWVDRSADHTCAICGSQRRARSLRTVIPELAGRQAVAVEVVSGAAAKKLRLAGDIGAWLHAAKKRRRATMREKAEIASDRDN